MDNGTTITTVAGSSSEIHQFAPFALTEILQALFICVAATAGILGYVLQGQCT